MATENVTKEEEKVETTENVKGTVEKEKTWSDYLTPKNVGIGLLTLVGVGVGIAIGKAMDSSSKEVLEIISAPID